MKEALDQIVAEIRAADGALVLEGGASILALVGEEMLARFGVGSPGKADVKIDIDDEIVITIRWPEPSAEIIQGRARE